MAIQGNAEGDRAAGAGALPWLRLLLLQEQAEAPGPYGHREPAGAGVGDEREGNSVMDWYKFSRGQFSPVEDPCLSHEEAKKSPYFEDSMEKAEFSCEGIIGGNECSNIHVRLYRRGTDDGAVWAFDFNTISYGLIDVICDNALDALLFIKEYVVPISSLATTQHVDETLEKVNQVVFHPTHGIPSAVRVAEWDERRLKAAAAYRKAQEAKQAKV